MDVFVESASASGDSLGLLTWPLVLVAAAWLLAPCMDWRSSSRLPVEAHVARTSFPYTVGELVPPAWKSPEVALSVVIPAFNEEHRLPAMLEETLSYLEARVAASLGRFSFEVIVVDDGSGDATYAAALATAGKAASGAHRRGVIRGGDVRVVRLGANHGKGFAVRVGMLIARGQWLLMSDADGATNIRDLERLEAAVSPSDAVPGPLIAFGSRHHLKVDASPEASWRHWFCSLLASMFGLWVWVLTAGTAQDTQCGFKLFHARLGKRIFASLHTFGWAFDVEVALLSWMMRQHVAEVPVTWCDMAGSKFHQVAGAAAMLRETILIAALYGVGLWQPAF